jgi:hypothetical protein
LDSTFSNRPIQVDPDKDQIKVLLKL